jgi:glucarate dehydratase
VSTSPPPSGRSTPLAPTSATATAGGAAEAPGRARVVAVDVTVVNIPYEAPTITSSLYARPGISRTLVEVRTDDGLVGLGEGMGGDDLAAQVRAAALDLIGEDPFRIEYLLNRLLVERGHRPHAVSALEFALWDVVGQACGRPLYDLLGGRFRERVPICGVLLFRDTGVSGKGGEATPEAIAGQAVEIVERFGFPALKWKAGVRDLETDLQIMRLIRDAVGDAVRLRIDPNSVWSVDEAVSVVGRLAPLDLEWIEDPCKTLEELAAARSRVDTAFASDGVAGRPADLPRVAAARAVDIAKADTAAQGGLLGFRRFATVGEACGLGVGMHSSAELGVATAARMHLLAATPNQVYAVDHTCWYHADDVVAGGMAALFGAERDGCMAPPDRPGLGVRLDAAKVAHYAALHAAQGDYQSQTTHGGGRRW